MSKIPNDVQKAFDDILNNFDGLDVKYTDEDSINHELYANITNADSYSDFKNKIESEFEKVDYSDMYDAVEYTKQTDFGQIVVEFLDDNRLGITVDWSYLADQMKDDSSEEVTECSELFESETSDDVEISEVMNDLFADDKADIRTKVVGDDLDYDVTYAGETVHVTFDDVEGKFKYYINGFGPYESSEAKDIENDVVNFIVTRGQNNKIEESISSVTRQHGLLKSEAADMYRAGYALCLSEDCKSVLSKADDYAQFCKGKDVNGKDIKREHKTRDVFKVRHIAEGTMYKRISNYDEFDNGNVIHTDWSKLSAEAAEELAKQKSIEHPDQIFYVQYDDVMEPCSDLRWVNGKSYNWSDIKFSEGKPVITSVKEAISSVEPISPFKRGVRTTSCLTKDRKWDVTVDEAGNILARSRHGKPQYFKGTINDKVNDFPYTDEDNIILAAREQFELNFNNAADDNDSEVVNEDKYTRNLAKRLKSLTSDDTDNSKDRKKEKQVGSWKVVQTNGAKLTVADGFTSEYEAAEYVDAHGGVSKLKVVKESLKEAVDNDTKELFKPAARDKVFSIHIYNHHPFSGAIELMDEVDENGEGRKLKFTSRDEMNSKADELLDNGYISYTYKRSQDESLYYSLEESLKESVDENSLTDYELARPNSVKLMSYINRGSINPEDALSSLIDYLSDGEVGEFLDYIVGEYDLDESLNESFKEEVEPGKYVIRSFAKAANPYVAEYSRKTGKHIGYLGDGGRSWLPADSKGIMTFDTYDEAAAYAEDKVKDFYNAEVFKVERPLELEENYSDGDFKNQLIDDLTKQFFSREEAVKLVDKDINWAENLAYGNATPEDFIEAEEWLANN